jgi:cytochrome c-type biogenesis protein CcmH
MIWFVLAALTVAAAMSVLLPLARARASAGVERSEADLAFFEAETANIARDLDRGIIDEKEAEGARAEAARRLLATAAVSGGKTGHRDGARRAAAVIAIVVIASAGVGLYAIIGAPLYSDQPLVARRNAPPDQMDIMAAVAKIESHLARNPGDARGYEVIAPVYMRIGRFADAAKAWGEVIRLSGATPERLTLMGESLIFANEGKAPAEAVMAFERALSLDAAFPQARFYLGLAAEQAGDKAKATDIWSRLLADAEPGAPWADLVRERLKGLGAQSPAPAAQPGPRGDAAAAIAALPAADRDMAIRGMVDSLAARLANDGNDAAGWLRLVRAYTVLKEPQKAKAALGDARRALASDSAALQGLDELARELGLEG